MYTGRSIEDERLQKKTGRQLFIGSFANPLFLAAYMVFWYVLAKLCTYGGTAKRVPILAACGVVFLGNVLVFFFLKYKYLKRELPHVIFTAAQVEANGKLHFLKEEKKVPEEKEEDSITDYSISLSEIKKVKKSRRYLYFFLTKSRMVILDKKKIAEYDLEFLQLFISRINPFKKVNYQFAAYLLIFAVTVCGSIAVAKSAANFSGKLSWKLLELKQKRYISLHQNNLYETGLNGIVKALEEKLSLPEHLTVSGSFSLKFSKDGSITSFDTHLSGFDSHYSYINSYLVTYDATKSDKMEVYVQDNATGKYEEEKDFVEIVRMCGEIPFEETVKNWEAEEFGLLSYGERSFGYNTEGVRYIDKDGRVELPLSAEEELSGVSVSVYVPQKEEEMIPVRYIYCEDVTENPNIVRKAEREMMSVEEESNVIKVQNEVRQTEEESYELISGYPLWLRASYALEDYGTVEEAREEYGCKHDIRLYSVADTKYQLSGESDAIKKINAYLEAEEEEFMEQAMVKAEEIENYSDSPCICKDYAKENGFYLSDSASFRVRIIEVNEEFLQLYINKNYYNGGKGTNQDELLLFCLETGEKLELSDVVRLSKKQIRKIINESFEKVQENYTFEEGKTAADLWFDNPELCGFYFMKENLIFHFDGSLFPEPEENGMSVEIVYPLTKN